MLKNENIGTIVSYDGKTWVVNDINKKYRLQRFYLSGNRKEAFEEKKVNPSEVVILKKRKLSKQEQAKIKMLELKIDKMMDNGMYIQGGLLAQTLLTFKERLWKSNYSKYEKMETFN